MRGVMRLALVGAALAAAGVALAQGRGGFGFVGPGMVAFPPVQEELKLTDEQKEKARDFAQKLREKGQAIRDEHQGDVPRIRAEMQKVNAAALKEAAGFLKTDQVKRLKQIIWQQAGVNALATDEELQKELKLTNEQKEKLTKLTAELGEKTMEAFQGGPGPETFQKVQALGKEYGDKGTALLTEDQRKSYKELLGKQFDMPPFGGRGGFGKGKDK
jgi:Spy/CpxP family protein refolding chaperone